MKIELIHYEHTCHDGCCYTSGYDVIVDDVFIGSIESEDAQELADLLNETFNTKEWWNYPPLNPKIVVSALFAHHNE